MGCREAGEVEVVDLKTKRAVSRSRHIVGKRVAATRDGFPRCGEAPEHEPRQLSRSQRCWSQATAEAPEPGSPKRSRSQRSSRSKMVERVVVCSGAEDASCGARVGAASDAETTASEPEMAPAFEAPPAAAPQAAPKPAPDGGSAEAAVAPPLGEASTAAVVAAAARRQRSAGRRWRRGGTLGVGDVGGTGVPLCRDRQRLELARMSKALPRPGAEDILIAG
eukprot:CAMPEP_0177424612 /NCGR_PEP_ID=MMETSP0368-20130122/72554_1 /TAXON_ID=447022 ORGANISM="Scrippsiella hangoei-like, Strain SHHI-4" /NCGR_SAMPLE_ID=MMETSP0368 /ASSEMBLY_ACC=CAM_ASM_000363 /LENGTH=221 /DNA_ID=CAMNT_0018894827 /DNA_START=18 /DNA_END=683 /DNA_ORIENTATION=+